MRSKRSKPAPPKDLDPIVRRRFSITEFCALVGLGKSTAYVRIKQGELKVTRDGGRVFISATEVDLYLARCEEAK
jgi:excisionase family DNA binding protein